MVEEGEELPTTQNAENPETPPFLGNPMAGNESGSRSGRSMNRPTHGIAGWLSGALLFSGAATPAMAQETTTNTVTATVPSLGAVLALSPLVPGIRLPTGDLFVLGTVTTRHNGPYRLQARLAEPFVVRTGSALVVNEVMARIPGGSLVMLGTLDWVTLATGPGGSGLINPVEFLVIWGGGSRKSPGLAVQFPVVYQVVPL